MAISMSRMLQDFSK